MPVKLSWLLCLCLAAALGRVAGKGACPAIPAGADNVAPVEPGLEYGSFQDFGSEFAAPWLSPVAFPGGVKGTETVTEALAAFTAGRLGVLQTFMTSTMPAMYKACLSLSEDGDCITSLQSFQDIYAGLPAAVQPALANFSDSDSSFARMRITVAPLLLRKASNPLPIDPSSIVGLDDIISNTGMTLPQLVAAGRVFVQDYRPLAPYLSPSPNSYLEIPTALFFVDGADAEAGTGPQLMPLAIKFNTYNNNTYSPRDPSADWFMAKAFFNSLDTFVHANIHFVQNHFILENFCITAGRKLASTHPLYPLITNPCFQNPGIIADGLNLLFINTTSAFDIMFAASGWSAGQALAPALLSQFKWESSYLETDVAQRGVQDIPGFAYKDDAGAIYAALLSYAKSVLGAYYAAVPEGEAAAITGDAQLQAFLVALSSGQLGSVPGFPSASNVTSVDNVARVAAQVMWLAGTQHHAVNTDKMYNYDFVYPIAPSKLFAPPPANKGEVTEDLLLTKFILPQVVPMPTGPVPPTSPSFLYVTSLLEIALKAAIPNATLPDPKTINGFAYFLEILNLLMPPNPPGVPANATLGFTYYVYTQFFTAVFALEMKADIELGLVYAAGTPAANCTGHDTIATAAGKLVAELAAISVAIQQREAKLLGVLPQFTLLDPTHLPFYSYV